MAVMALLTKKLPPNKYWPGPDSSDKTKKFRLNQ